MRFFQDAWHPLNGHHQAENYLNPLQLANSMVDRLTGGNAETQTSQPNQQLNNITQFGLYDMLDYQYLEYNGILNGTS